MRIALLSDLHFGRARPELVQPLLDALTEAKPELIVIAGDFVQRARASQYKLARELIDRLPAPMLAVPGNHDIPLFNLPERLFAPRRAYRHWIARDTEPMVETPEAVIAGLDTTDRMHHQRGSVSETQIARVARIIERTSADRTVVVVAHHPFHQDEKIEKKLMLGAPRALEAWGDAGPHMIVSGHLHTWTVEPFTARRNRSMTLQVHCGTGLSTRVRGEPNDFALIDLRGRTARIERRTATDDNAFTTSEVSHFTVGDGGWERIDHDPSP